MNLRQLQTLSDSRVRSLFGLTASQLGTLMAALLPVLHERRQTEQRERPHRKRAPGGGRKRMLTPAQEVLLVLLYLRHNTSHALCGQLFGVSADKSEKVFHEIIPVLEAVCPSDRWDAQKRWQKGEPTWRPSEEERLLIDSFETPLPRPGTIKTAEGKARDRRFYSGKKRRHTMKSQLVSDTSGEIVHLKPGYPGPTADKRILEDTAPQLCALCPKAQMQGDLAYIGTYYTNDFTDASGNARVLVPHRRKNCQKTPNLLTDEQKAENQSLARVRVHVEHAIRRVKAWRILRDEYRLNSQDAEQFSSIAHVVVGLVQMSRLCC